MSSYYPKRIHELNVAIVALIKKAGELRRENEEIKAQLERTKKTLKKMKESK